MDKREELTFQHSEQVRLACELREAIPRLIDRLNQTTEPADDTEELVRRVLSLAACLHAAQVRERAMLVALQAPTQGVGFGAGAPPIDLEKLAAEAVAHVLASMRK